MSPSRVHHTLRAIVAELRAAWMIALQHRLSFVGEAVATLLWLGFTLFPLLVVYRNRPGIEGWTYHESLLVVGLFLTLQGCLQAFIDPNLRAVVEHVRRGTMDFILLKPVDAQILVSFHRTAPAKLLHVAGGLAVTGVAAASLPTAPSAPDIGLAAILLVASGVVLYSLWTMIVSLSFWFVKVDNLTHLFQGFLESARWPVTFYPSAVRLVLTFVLPVGLMTTYPAMAMRGALEPAGALTSFGVAALFLVLSRVVWQTAVRRYSSASS